MTTAKREDTLTEMLEKARQERGLSKIRAAAVLGTSPNNYRQWLRGQRPDWKFVDTIIDFTRAEEVEVLVAIWRHGPEPPRPQVASPLSLDLGKAASPRYVKLAHPKDTRPPSLEKAA